MNWQILIADAPQKQLKRIYWQDSERIAVVIGRMKDDPFVGDVQKMAGKAAWRRRVGSYRIFYKLFPESRSIYIYEITRRTSKTY